MLLSRRQIIEAGAAYGALATMGSPLLAAVPDAAGRARPDRLSDLRIDEIDPPAARPVPAAARPASSSLIDPRMVARARSRISL